jgi:dolichyl-phosphate-mannose--protein O-mannosyl transferase
MYIWKVEKLIGDFRDDNVCQKEQFKYVIASAVLLALSTDPILYVGSKYSINDSIGTLLFLLTSIWGTYYCFKINSQNDNKDFVLRSFCLGLPVVVRTLVFFTPVLLVGGAVEGFLGRGFTVDENGNELMVTTLGMIFVIEIFVIVYFLRLGKAITAVSLE